MLITQNSQFHHSKFQRQRMDSIQYIGEHLLPGQIGQLAALFAFISSALAAIAYYFATQRAGTREEDNWLFIGRSAFVAHGLGIFLVIGVIFYIMLNQYYEYQYVQAHVSSDLPLRYIFSAFWEGQEGSFLIWMFWHIVLGMILMLTAKNWEAPTLSVLALVQAILGSMILGLYVTEELRVGSSPLLLLRETMDAPIFRNADYLSLIKGNGLTPALQNYWMTIHPPTLFLGFASTVVPFCFAIAGLWTKQHKAWLKPALRWSLFSAGILGTGILMGGAWAYEALNFGGYWAWDPVENASLVPWLILLAGIHSNLIANATGHSVRTSYIFYILTFLFVLYSTFLTRSGVLGETSVHAFTEMGLETQLIILMSTFFLLGFGLFAIRNKSIPSPVKEEATPSREFWMFIGTLVLLFSSVLITGSTSLPIYNKIRQVFDPVFEGIVIDDANVHYNKYQLWIAVFISMLSGVAQYLRYREVNFGGYARKFATHIGISLAITAVLTYLLSLWINLHSWQYVVLLATCLFTIIANLDYFITFAKGNKKAVGAALSHIGFGVMIIGVLASSLNKTVISSDPFAMQGLFDNVNSEDKDFLKKNIVLLKNNKTFMDKYEVTYESDDTDKHIRTFNLDFKLRDEAGKVVENFMLNPNILYNKDFTKIDYTNPSTKHYLTKDIFTHVSSLSKEEIDPEFAKTVEDSLKYTPFDVEIGQIFALYDTIKLSNLDTAVVRTYQAEVLEVSKQGATHPDYVVQEGDLSVGAKVKVSFEDSVYYANPILVLRGQYLYSFPDKVNALTTKIKIDEAIFDRLFAPEEELEYQTFQVKQGETFQFQGHALNFTGFDKQPTHPAYDKEEGDIAVSAVLNIDGKYQAKPLYLIRGNRPFNLKDEVADLGLHLRFASIDPKTESMEIMVAKQTNIDRRVPLAITTDSPRSDYIVLQAIEFQGINLFWLGSVVMLLGLFFSMWQRRLEKY